MAAAGNTQHIERNFNIVSTTASSDNASTDSRAGLSAIAAANELDLSPVEDNCVHTLYAAQARTNPVALAIRDANGRSISYAALDAQTNQLARRLQSLGVGPGVPVGLLLPRSIDFVVAALAVLKAGGAYLPMDPAYPRDRCAFQLLDAKAPVVITAKPGDVSAEGVHEISLSTEMPVISRLSSESVTTTAQLSDLAYVIYTSGSTGQPKGVEITHRSLLNLIAWHRRAFSLTPADRTSQVAGLGFDAAVWEIWPSLVSGASLHLAAEDIRASPEKMGEWLVSERITVSFAPTVITEQLILLPWPNDTALRWLLTGADTLAHFPPAGLPFRLVNNYGPTEFTVVATSGVIEPSDNPAGLPSIGHPIDGAKIYVLDGNFQPVKEGCPGELFLSGDSLAQGYRNRPELTQERFLPNPFSAVEGERMYRTGDLVRVLDNGEIAFLGRADDQIKIRGFRIEPGEISSVLDSHPKVRASVVVAREDKNREKRLVAYVVLREHEQPLSTELHEYLASKLPDWMVPSVFVALKELPLTANGKIDRVALPAPEQSQPLSPSDQEDPPRSALEQSISDVLSAILGFPYIGVHENFFALGGHSLMGAQVIARLRDLFGVQLTLRDLFTSRTIASLADRVEQLLIDRLESMSDEDVSKALSSSGESAHGGALSA